MNARIVVSSSEIVLRELLEGQPPDLVEELTRDLRIRQTFRWAGPEVSRAPFVVRRRDPGGGESVEATRNLIASGKLRWDPGALAFVAQPDDPAEYTIPGDDEDLSEVLDHPSVPEIVRDGLREYQARTEPSPDARQRVLAAIRTQLEPIRPLRIPQGPFVLRPADQRRSQKLAAKEASCGDSTETWILHAADGREIQMTHLRKSEECTIELMYPLPEDLEPSELVLMVGGQPIKPIFPLNKYGYCRVRYEDIRDVIEGKCMLDIT